MLATQRIFQSIVVRSRTILASRTSGLPQKSKPIANPFSFGLNFKAMTTSEPRKHKPYSFCHYCGAQYGPENTAFPKKCSSCSNKIYINPLPVAVIIVPVDNGVMLIRRSIEPAKGQLAFPGGYIDHSESWQEGGAREVWEEAGLKLDPAQIKEFKILNGTGKILIFGVYEKTFSSKDLPPFENTGETLERLVVTEPVKLGFDLHQQVIDEYFRLKSENKL